MDRIAELLANLQGIAPEELAELTAAIDSQYDEIVGGDKTPDTVATLTKLVEAREQAKAESGRRAQEQAEAERAAEELQARMEQARSEEEAPAETPETPEAEGGDPAEGETPEQPEGEQPAPEATAPEGGPIGALPVAASAAPGTPAPAAPIVASAPRGTTPGGRVAAMAAANGRANARPEGTATTRYGASVIAAAGLGYVVPGSEFADRRALAEAMSEKLMQLQASQDRSRALVASARWEYPEDRRLGSDAQRNTELIDAVCSFAAPRVDRGTGALVASGGICLPVNVDYSVPTWSTGDRPLRDALPAFQASRGGLRYVTPPDIGTVDLQGTAAGAGTATRVWSEATDANPGGATKPVWQVACGTEQLVYVDAIPTRVEFGNMQSRFAPEQVAANTEQAINTAAREAELNLLTKIAASTTQVKPVQYLGAHRDLLASVDLLRAQYIYSHRFPRNIGLTAIFPDWARDLIRADVAREIGHDDSGTAVRALPDSAIDEWFRVRGVEPIWTLESLKAGTYGTGGSAITDQFFAKLGTNAPKPQWPGQSTDGSFMLVWFLFVTGTFQFLDGGRLDLGVVRDSVLDATNDYETFVEPFEGIAFRGVEAYQVQSTILPTGGTAGTVAAASYHE